MVMYNYQLIAAIPTKTPSLRITLKDVLGNFNKESLVEFYILPL
jgi:hypothetical protein